jgi:hypothetical protein
VIEVGFGLVVGEGFGWGRRELRGFGAGALEFVEGAAVKALGLGLVAEEAGPGVLRPAVHVDEALGEDEVTVLGPGDFEAADEGLGHDGDLRGVLDDVVQGAGEDAGFQAVGAEDGLLGEGHALEGEHFLGGLGLIEGDEVGAEVGDFVEVLEADDGEGGRGEAVFAGVLGRVGFALGGAGTGGFLGVGAVGGELGGRHSSVYSPFRDSAPGFARARGRTNSPPQANSLPHMGFTTRRSWRLKFGLGDFRVNGCAMRGYSP